MQDVHIGPVPPLYGGISVYLYRLSKLEKNALFIDYYKYFKRFNRFKPWWLKDVILNFKKKNFIFHSTSIRDALILYFLTNFSIHEFSLVIHGRSLKVHYNKSNKIIKFLIRNMLNKAKFIQVVNPEYEDFIKKLNVKNKNIFVKNAFLPPPLEEENKIINTYKPELIDFLNVKKPLIVANGSFLNFYNNIDLYGLDLCIELTAKLKKNYPNLGFIFALANESKNAFYLKKMINLIRKLKIEENFYFLTGHRELWPIFKKADLLARPTNTDGDSISIRESLYFETPVVASNVTSRPEGCVIFKSRDLRDFYTKCNKLLNTKLKN